MPIPINGMNPRVRVGDMGDRICRRYPQLPSNPLPKHGASCLNANPQTRRNSPAASLLLASWRTFLRMKTMVKMAQHLNAHDLALLLSPKMHLLNRHSTGKQTALFLFAYFTAPMGDTRHYHHSITESYRLTRFTLILGKTISCFPTGCFDSIGWTLVWRNCRMIWYTPLNPNRVGSSQVEDLLFDWVVQSVFILRQSTPTRFSAAHIVKET